MPLKVIFLPSWTYNIKIKIAFGKVRINWVQKKERIKIIAMRNRSFLRRKCAFHISNLVAMMQWFIWQYSHYLLFFLYLQRLCTLLILAFCIPKWKQKSNWNNPMHRLYFNETYIKIFIQTSCPPSNILDKISKKTFTSPYNYLCRP